MVLSERLTERIRAKPPIPMAAGPGGLTGQRAQGAASDAADWFCPWCGEAVTRGARGNECAACGGVLEGGYLYALVGLHSHRNWPRRQRSIGFWVRVKWARFCVWWRWGV